MYIRLIKNCLIVLVILVNNLFANTLNNTNSINNTQYNFYTSPTFVGTATGIAAVGLLQWNWFSNKNLRLKYYKERQFQKDTYEGGADKLGHAYTNYIISDAFIYVLKQNDVEHKTAVFTGAGSSFALMALIEFGDSTSYYGFSHHK